MNNTTVYVGMGVHMERFSLCAFTIEVDKASHHQKTKADYKKVLKYLEHLRTLASSGWITNFSGQSRTDSAASRYYSTVFLT